jgi:hypothetical protein
MTLVALRGANSITEGWQSASARLLAVVLGANCCRLGSISGPNPRQFGSREAQRATAGVPIAAHSLPSMSSWPRRAAGARG